MTNLNQTLVRPPVSSPIVNNMMLTAPWLMFFNNLYQLISTTLQAGYSVPSLTTAQQSANPQYSQQVFIYNTDSGELQINLNGTLYNLTKTAA
jgi:hypothetical protein